MLYKTSRLSGRPTVYNVNLDFPGSEIPRVPYCVIRVPAQLSLFLLPSSDDDLVRLLPPPPQHTHPRR